MVFGVHDDFGYTCSWWRYAERLANVSSSVEDEYVDYGITKNVTETCRLNSLSLGCCRMLESKAVAKRCGNDRPHRHVLNQQLLGLGF